MDSTEKEILYKHCSAYIQGRINRLREEIALAQHSANEETKRSMGDKYETSRAMTQLDIERNMVQLKEAEKINTVLQNISIDQSSDRISPGSLIKTTKGVFYIGISIGVVKLDNKEYLIVSADSPVGKLLLGKKKGDTFRWSTKDYTILDVE